MKNYSQNQEQQHILKYFGDFRGDLLSIGENDGITLSNIRALLELGWGGHAAEPSPKAYARLVENSKYPPIMLRCWDIAITDQDGEAPLFESGELLGSGDISLVSSLDQKEIDRFPDVSREKVMVKTMKWETFWNHIGRHPFQFVSIDAEGFDEKILKQMDLEAIGVRCLAIEWNLKEDLKRQYIEYMKGYHIIYQSAENLVFAK